MRRRRSLLGTAARTAVIAGTASAVSGRAARSRSAQSAGPAGLDASREHIDQLERLSRLHDSGALSDAEFRKEKSRIIG